MAARTSAAPTARGGKAGVETALNRAVDLIVDGIRQGRYAPGQRLIEADLIEELGVSRSSIREALRRLEAQGLVEMVLHRGARVRRLTADDISELYEARAIVEAGAARLAAQRIDLPGNAKKMKASLKNLQTAANKVDVVAYYESVSQFHDTLIELSGNKRLATLIDTLRLQTLRFIFLPHLTGATALMKKSLPEFERITDLVLAGDADRAQAAVRAQIEATSHIALEVVSSF